MRAAINSNYGTPDVFREGELDVPEIKANQVLVKVHASTVTQGDRRLRAADFPGISAIFGRLVVGVLGPRRSVGGTNFSGRVVAVGADVTRYAAGDDVFGGVMHGAYAEYLAVSEYDAIAKMPQSISYAEAAAIPYGAITALEFLRDIAKVERGERVLIVGASGGVGRMAVQVAKSLGAHVTGVAGRGAQVAHELGADAVINYAHEDFRERNEKWDLIFDTTEGHNFRSFRSALTERGRYLTVYMTLRILFEMAVTKLRGGPRAIAGVAMGSPKVMDDVRILVEQGAVRSRISERYPLGQMTAAHAYLEETHPHGSVVIEMPSTLEHASAPTS